MGMMLRRRNHTPENSKNYNPQDIYTHLPYPDAGLSTANNTPTADKGKVIKPLTHNPTSNK